MSGLKARQASIIGEAQFRKFGVLVPLVEKNGELHILFEVRAKHLRSQPGDVCFPGGKMDPTDRDAMFCAIRETSEELGVPSEAIHDVVPLDYIVSESGQIIYPFAGRLEKAAEIMVNEEEVEEVFTVPLDFFLHTEPETYKVHLKVQPEADFPYDLIYNGEDYNWNVRKMTETFYQYDSYVIWGLTAKILVHFLGLISLEKGIEEK